MTEDEIRGVFEELRRIGVDLGRPPGLALGTGFAAGEFLPWLRALPTGLGHDRFAERLTAYVSAASPLRARASTAEPKDPTDGTAPEFQETFRAWPTHEQLDLGIDVLLNEWDPLGARLGALSREAVEHHAFNLLGCLVGANPAVDRARVIAAQLGEIEEEVFDVRKSPVEQRRYLGRRLVAIVDEHPTPPLAKPIIFSSPPVDNGRDARVTAGPNRGRPLRPPTHFYGSHSAVAIGPTGHEPPSALDPTATCAQCGTTGTVSFVTRDVEPFLSQYCRTCWQEVRSWAWGGVTNFNTRKPETPHEMIDAMDHMHLLMLNPIRSAGSALWEDRFEMIETMTTRQEEETEEQAASRASALGRIARDLADHASEMDGPMPPKVEAFVREYGVPEA